MPQRAVVDVNFTKVLESLRVEAKSFADNLRTNRPPEPFTTEELRNSDGLQDFESVNAGIAAVFKLPQAENALIETYKPESPGNIGDNLVLTTQMDYAAQMERAYRARYLQSFPRMIAHTVNRKQGHGQVAGLFTGQVAGYVTTLLKRTANAGEQ